MENRPDALISSPTHAIGKGRKPRPRRRQTGNVSNATELRAKIAAFGLTHAAFARMIGVTPSASARWLDGTRTVPAYVSLIFDILTELGPAARTAIIERYAHPKVRPAQSP